MHLSTVPPHLRRLLLSTSALTGLVALSTVAQAGQPGLPTNGTVTAGSATIAQAGANQLTVTTGTSRTIIDWQSFSIASGNKVAIQQPGASSITVNEVTGGDPSKIFGDLSSNGRVVLANPNGIWFGPDSHVDVAGLVASTATLSADAKKAFASGGRLSLDVAGKSTASIVNDGQMTIAGAGLAALVAPGVRNNGVIEASLGSVTLSSGQTSTLDFYGDGLVSLAVTSPVQAVAIGPDGKPFKATIENNGKLAAQHVLVTADVVKGVVDNSINMSGVVEAKGVTVSGGDIVLDGGEGDVTVAGTVDVTSQQAKGGSVAITGGTVTLTATAKIDASGAKGGGTVQIGGGPHGSGSLKHATTVLVQGGSAILANALSQGDGGTVSVWSDGQTGFAGSIEAKGAGTGNGGWVETSGHYLSIAGGRVDTTAPAGLIGTWLLDPFDIDVEDSASTTSNYTTTSYMSPSGGSIVYDTDLNAALGSSNVTLQTGGTGGTITVNGGAAITWTGSETLTLDATASGPTGGISLLAPITGKNGTLTLASAGTTTENTQGTIWVNAAEFTGGGQVTLTATLNQIAVLAANTGSLSLNNGANPLAIGTAGSTSGVTLTGDLALISVANLTLNNNVVVSGAGGVVFTPGVTLGADVTVDTSSGNGPITLGGITGAGHALNINAGAAGTGGAVDLSAGVSGLSALTVSGGSIALSGTVATTGAQSYTGDVTVAGSPTFSAVAGNINFAGKLDEAAGGQDMMVQAGLTYSITFQGAVGSEHAPSSFTAQAGTINIAGVTTTGNQTYTGPVTLSAASTFAASVGGADISFSDVITGGSDLAVSVPNGTVEFNGAVGTIQSATVTAGTITVGGDVHTVNAQSYTGNLVFTGNSALVSDTAGIAVSGTIDASSNGTYNISLTTPTSAAGIVTVGGAVGATNPLTSFTVTANAVSLGSVTTTNDQTYTAATQLRADATFSSTVSGTIGFEAIDGAYALTVNPSASGTVNFSGRIGDLTPLSSLTVSAAGINLGSQSGRGLIYTQGTQSYDGAFVLDNDSALHSQAGSIDFTDASTINGANVVGQALWIAASQDFRAPTAQIGGNKPFYGVTLVSDTLSNGTPSINAQNTPAIITTGGTAQTFNNGTFDYNTVRPGGAIELSLGTTIVATDINMDFTGPVKGGDSSEIQDAGRTIAIHAIFGGASDPLASLQLDASKILLGADLNTTGTLTINGDTVLIADAAVTSASGTVNLHKVSGPWTLTVNAGLGINLGGNIGDPATMLADGVTGETPLAGLSLTASGTIAAPAIIRTAGGTDDQSYQGDFVISTDTTVSATGNIQFQSIDGAANFTATSSGGGTVYASAIGQSTPLVSLIVNGRFTPSGAVNTTGNQSYNGDLLLNQADAVLTSSGGGTITFQKISGAYGLAVNDATGIVKFQADVGNTTTLLSDGVTEEAPLDALTVTANSIQIGDSGAITIATVHNQAYTGNVVLNTQTTLIATNPSSTLHFYDTIDGAVDVNLTAGDTVFFDGDAGGVTPFSTLTVNGNFSPFETTTTVANQSYYGETILRQPSSFISTGAGTIYFQGKVTTDGSNQPLTASSVGGTIRYDNDLGTSAVPLTTISLTGNLIQAGQNVYTSGDQGYHAPVTLGADAVVTSTGGNIAFDSTIDGNQSLTISAASGDVAISGNVGYALAVHALTLTAETLNGARTYGGTSPGINLYMGTSPTINLTGVPASLTGELDNGTYSFSDSNLLTLTGVTLGADTTITVTGGDIKVTGAIDSASAQHYRLTLVDSATNTITVMGAIGSINPIGNLILSSGGVSIQNSVTTTGNIVSTVASHGSFTVTSAGVISAGGVLQVSADSTQVFSGSAGDGIAILVQGQVAANGIYLKAADQTVAPNVAGSIEVSGTGLLHNTETSAGLAFGMADLVLYAGIGGTVTLDPGAVISADKGNVALIGDTLDIQTAAANLAVPGTLIVSPALSMGQLQAGTGYSDFSNGIDSGSPNILTGAGLPSELPEASISVGDGNGGAQFILSQTTLNNLSGVAVNRLQIGLVGNTAAISVGDASDQLVLPDANSTIRGDTITVSSMGVGAEGSLSFVAGTGITLAGFVTSGGGQSYFGPVSVASNITLTDISLNGAISFSGPLDGAVGTENLIVDASGANSTVVFGDAVAGSNGLGSLSVTAGQSITFMGPVGTGSSPLGSFSLSSAANSVFDVTTGGMQEYIGTTTLQGTISSDAGAITFDDNVLLDAPSITVQSTGGNIEFKQYVDGTSVGANALTVTSGAGVYFDNHVGATALASLTVTGAAIEVKGTLDTVNDQNFTGPVDILADSSFTSSVGSITFNNDINGNSFEGQALSITANSGTVTVQGIGQSTAIGILTISATTFVGNPAFINAANGTSGISQDEVLGAGTYNYDDITPGYRLVLTADTTITGSNENMVFTGAIDGAYALILVDSNNFTIALQGAVGSTTPLTALTFQGGHVNIQAPVTLSGNGDTTTGNLLAQIASHGSFEVLNGGGSAGQITTNGVVQVSVDSSQTTNVGQLGDGIQVLVQGSITANGIYLKAADQGVNPSNYRGTIEIGSGALLNDLSPGASNSPGVANIILYSGIGGTVTLDATAALASDTGNIALIADHLVVADLPANIGSNAGSLIVSPASTLGTLAAGAGYVDISSASSNGTQFLLTAGHALPGGVTELSTSVGDGTGGFVLSSALVASLSTPSVQGLQIGLAGYGSTTTIGNSTGTLSLPIGLRVLGSDITVGNSGTGITSAGLLDFNATDTLAIAKTVQLTNGASLSGEGDVSVNITAPITGTDPGSHLSLFSSGTISVAAGIDIGGNFTANVGSGGSFTLTNTGHITSTDGPVEIFDDIGRAAGSNTPADGVTIEIDGTITADGIYLKAGDQAFDTSANPGKIVIDGSGVLTSTDANTGTGSNVADIILYAGVGQQQAGSGIDLKSGAKILSSGGNVALIADQLTVEDSVANISGEFVVIVSPAATIGTFSGGNNYIDFTNGNFTGGAQLLGGISPTGNNITIGAGSGNFALTPATAAALTGLGGAELQVGLQGAINTTNLVGPFTLPGNLTVYGGTISIDGGLTTLNGGSLFIQSTDAVTLAGTMTIGGKVQVISQTGITSTATIGFIDSLNFTALNGDITSSGALTSTIAGSSIDFYSQNGAASTSGAGVLSALDLVVLNGLGSGGVTVGAGINAGYVDIVSEAGNIAVNAPIVTSYAGNVNGGTLDAFNAQSITVGANITAASPIAFNVGNGQSFTQTAGTISTTGDLVTIGQQSSTGSAAITIDGTIAANGIFITSSGTSASVGGNITLGGSAVLHNTETNAVDGVSSADLVLYTGVGSGGNGLINFTQGASLIADSGNIALITDKIVFNTGSTASTISTPGSLIYSPGSTQGSFYTVDATGAASGIQVLGMQPGGLSRSVDIGSGASVVPQSLIDFLSGNGPDAVSANRGIVGSLQLGLYGTGNAVTIASGGADFTIPTAILFGQAFTLGGGNAITATGGIAIASSSTAGSIDIAGSITAPEILLLAADPTRSGTGASVTLENGARITNTVTSVAAGFSNDPTTADTIFYAGQGGTITLNINTQIVGGDGNIAFVADHIYIPGENGVGNAGTPSTVSTTSRVILSPGSTDGELFSRLAEPIAVTSGFFPGDTTLLSLAEPGGTGAPLGISVNPAGTGSFAIGSQDLAFFSGSSVGTLQIGLLGNRGSIDIDGTLNLASDTSALKFFAANIEVHSDVALTTGGAITFESTQAAVTPSNNMTGLTFDAGSTIGAAGSFVAASYCAIHTCAAESPTASFGGSITASQFNYFSAADADKGITGDIVTFLGTSATTATTGNISILTGHGGSLTLANGATFSASSGTLALLTDSLSVSLGANSVQAVDLVLGTGTSGYLATDAGNTADPVPTITLGDTAGSTGLYLSNATLATLLAAASTASTLEIGDVTDVSPLTIAVSGTVSLASRAILLHGASLVSGTNPGTLIDTSGTGYFTIISPSSFTLSSSLDIESVPLSVEMLTGGTFLQTAASTITAPTVIIQPGNSQTGLNIDLAGGITASEIFLLGSRDTAAGSITLESTARLTNNLAVAPDGSDTLATRADTILYSGPGGSITIQPGVQIQGGDANIALVSDQLNVPSIGASVVTTTGRVIVGPASSDGVLAGGDNGPVLPNSDEGGNFLLNGSSPGGILASIGINGAAGNEQLSQAAITLLSTNSGIFQLGLSGASNTVTFGGVTTIATGAELFAGTATVLAGATVQVQGDLDISATGLTLGGALVSSGGGVIIDAPIMVSAGAAASIAANGTGGDVAIFGTIDGPGGLAITATDGILLSDTVGATAALGSLALSANQITLSGNIATTGNQTYAGAVILDADVTVSASNSGSAIRFAGTIDAERPVGTQGVINTGNGVGEGAPPSAPSLTVTSAGSAEFDGAIGSQTPLDNFTLNAFNVVGSLPSIFTTGTQSINLTVSGVFSGNYSFQNFIDSSSMLLTGDTVITATNGVIQITGTIGGGHVLTLNDDGATVSVTGGIDASNPLAGLVINASHGIILGGTLITTGAQVYNGPLTLAADTMLNASGTITLGGTVDGAYGLVLNGSGGIVMTGPVGSGTALTAFSATGPISVSNVTTIGGQSYSGAVTLTGATSLTAGAGGITFSGPIDGAQALSINDAAGAVNLTGTVGGTNALTGLTINAATIGLASVTTVGAQLYAGQTTLGGLYVGSGFSVVGPTLLAAATTVSAGTGGIIFGGTIDGAQALVLADPTGAVALAGAVGATTALASLTITGATITTGSVTTSGLQAYTGALALGGTYTGSGFQSTGTDQLAGATTIDAGTGGISLAGTVDGNQALVLNDAAGTVSLTGGVGGKSALAGLSVNAASIDLGSITTAGAQSYTGATTLGGAYVGSGFSVAGPTLLSAATIVSAGAGGVSFGGTVDGAQSLVLNDLTGTVTLAGTVGGKTALTSLTVNGAAITTGSVTTSGAQDYTGSMSLGGTYTGGSFQATGNEQLTGTTVVTATNGNLGVTGTIDGAQSLTLAATSGSVTVTGAVGGSTALSSLTLGGNADIVDFTGSVTTTQLTDTRTAGSLTLAGGLSTSKYTTSASNDVLISISGGVGPLSLAGEFDFATALDLSSRALTLTGTTVLDTSAGNGALTLGSVDGAYALTLNAGSAAVAFKGAVGATTALGGLTITGGTISLGNVHTTGAQVYNGAVTMGGTYIASSFTANGTDLLAGATGVTVTGGNIGLGALSGTQALTLVDTTGIVSLGNVTGLANLTITASGIVGGSVISTVGSQTYSGPLTLASTSALTSTAGDLTFGGTINGTKSLTLSAGGNITFGGTLAASTNRTVLSILTANNVTVINNSSLWVDRFTASAASFVFGDHSLESDDVVTINASSVDGRVISSSATLNVNTATGIIQGDTVSVTATGAVSEQISGGAVAVSGGSFDGSISATRSANVSSSGDVSGNIAVSGGGATVTAANVSGSVTSSGLAQITATEDVSAAVTGGSVNIQAGQTVSGAVTSTGGGSIVINANNVSSIIVAEGGGQVDVTATTSITGSVTGGQVTLTAPTVHEAINASSATINATDIEVTGTIGGTDAEVALSGGASNVTQAILGATQQVASNGEGGSQTDDGSDEDDEDKKKKKKAAKDQGPVYDFANQYIDNLVAGKK